MELSFSPQKILDYHFIVKKLFTDYFSGLGYQEHTPAPIISFNDRSVRFIGSTTNVFKPYIINNPSLPSNGFFLIQRCLRTQNATSFFDDKFFPEWGSYFTEIGLITPPDKLSKMTEDSLKYFTSILGIESERIILRVSSQDKDLLKCVKNTNLAVEIDGLPLKYYRHKYGLEMFLGRNFNFGIKNTQTGVIKDIGNIVIAEKENNKIAIEMGFGVSTLLARYYNLTNSIEASTISAIIPFRPGYVSKFSDALSSVVVMLKENIRPAGRDKERILRTYLRALNYLSKKIGFSIDDILEYAIDFEEIEYGTTSFLGDKIIQFLEEI